MSSDQMYGVTPPMKQDLPTDAELHATGLLIEQLKRENTFESPAETEKRYARVSEQLFASRHPWITDVLTPSQKANPKIS